MTRHEALTRLMWGVGQDVRDYRLLQALLDNQFHLALRHDTGRLAELAGRITGMVDALEQRRVERVQLVAQAAGEGAAMPAVFELTSGKHREALESGWHTLESLVRECKRLNARNCHLLMDQHDIMQRVLHGEASTYAAA